MKDKSNRLLAVEILENLISDKGSISSNLSRCASLYPGANLALVREFSAGVCRWYHQLDFILGLLMEKPLRSRDRDIRCLLLLGLYQLFHMRTPDHATVNETVAVTPDLKKDWAKGLVNAVLREAQRKRETLLESASREEYSRFSHPAWLVNIFRQDWPGNYLAILEGNNTQAPMSLRLDLNKCDRASYLERLKQAGIDAVAGKVADTAVILENPMDIETLPGFSEGLVSVQDEASQLAATILEPAPGSRVLDACAAPGGKTCAILERASGQVEMLVLDNSEERLVRIRENLSRLALKSEITCADAANTAGWWDGKPFDAILLDAPCSGTGVIRRNPDIKVLRKEADIERLSRLQQKLLESLWPCLAKGGKLLYSTCSVMREENEKQILAFLDSAPDAEPVNISFPEAVTCSAGLQFLPGRDNLDGFYYALMEKT